jgi:putative ABC transport system permease protein
MKNLTLEDIKEILKVEVRKTILHCNHVHLETNKYDPEKVEDSLKSVSTREDTLKQKLKDDLKTYEGMLDEKLEKLYATAQRRSNMLFAFSVLAVIISALGLYGLASFTAVRRTKEVGLRKVLGASSFRITAMMVRQFSMPVIWANVIAWPLAWYMAKDWLDGFEYRIEIDISIFFLFGIGALLIAWITVGGHAWNVARKKPVTALRYE